MRNLSRKFGNLFAVDDVTLQLFSDEIFWLFILKIYIL